MQIFAPMDALRPKKSLGQHFLSDENTARKIVDLLGAPPSARIIEIGPGMGVLTKYLVERYERVEVVEFDADAVQYLQHKFGQSSLKIHHADFLKWSPEDHLDEPAWFIGNLPYNVSSPIFFHLLENRHLVQQGIFMVQKEVADRVCAKEESEARQKGILSVLVSRYFQAKMQFKVKPTVFRPPPKVMSAVFSMDRLDQPGEPDFASLKRVVKAAFGKRRKTLRNALKELELNWEAFPADWPTLRAEALPYKAYNALAQAFHQTTQSP